MPTKEQEYLIKINGKTDQAVKEIKSLEKEINKLKTAQTKYGAYIKKHTILNWLTNLQTVETKKIKNLFYWS